MTEMHQNSLKEQQEASEKQQEVLKEQLQQDYNARLKEKEELIAKGFKVGESLSIS